MRKQHTSEWGVLTREAVSTVKLTDESGAVIGDNEHTIDDIAEH